MFNISLNQSSFSSLNWLNHLINLSINNRKIINYPDSGSLDNQSKFREGVSHKLLKEISVC